MDSKAIPCAFCDGMGKDPFGIMSPLSNCQVCGGKGTVIIREPAVVCAFCQGTGVHRDQRLTCTACGGRGMVCVQEPTMTGIVCQGTGWIGPTSSIYPAPVVVVWGWLRPRRGQPA